MNEEENRANLVFWIRSLAVSIFFLAVTFMLLATYLADIKGNTSAALARNEIIAQHLDTLDAELKMIRNHVVEPRAQAAAPVASPEAAPAAQPEAVPAPAAAPASESGASVTVPVPSVAAPASSLPAIQAPALSAPTVAPSKP